MKQFYATLSFIILLSYYSAAQMVTYHLQQSFTVASLDSFLNAQGFSLPVNPQYDVDVYQVIYKTPYKHIDSLVNASGIVVIPKNVACPMALGCYAHGTFSSRLQVPSYEGPERPIGLFFAGIGGILTVMPDELGLGDSDSSILIHPYISAFHSGYASVNIMRAARQLCDTLGLSLSGEVALTGYSQGGYTTMATHKLIQEQYPTEFNIVASAPMSGPYDLKRTMVEVMLSDSAYAAPSYLPYLLLGYHSVYPEMQQTYPTVSHFFKHPYDSTVPPMFYSKTFTTGDIEAVIPNVPKLMVIDTIIAAFASDTMHAFRRLLAENDLLGWAPQAPVKLFFCNGDRSVSHLNGLRAYDAWVANGAPNIEKQDLGNLDHSPCVEPSITGAAFYLLGKITDCPSAIKEHPQIAFRIFPNPASQALKIIKEEGEFELTVYDINGRPVYRKTLLNDNEILDLNTFTAGFYNVQLSDKRGRIAYKKLVVQ